MKNKLSRLATAVLTVSLGSGLAFADTSTTTTTTNSASLTLAPVTVVGTVNRLGKADSSASTLNINAQQVEQQTGATKLDQALIYLPGVYSNYAPSNHYNIFRIRGFSPEFAMDGASFTYPNGYYVYNPVLFGIERVEIVKGANSVLYGATQAGGVVNLVSKRPTATPQGLVQFKVGSDDTYQIGVDYSNRINDFIRYRVVGEWQHTRGQKDFTYTRQYYFAPSFTIDISDKTQLTILTSFNAQNGIPSNFVVPGYGSYITSGGSFSSSTYFGEPNYAKTDTKQYNLGWELTHTFNDRVKFEQNYRFNYINTYYFDVVAGMAMVLPTGTTGVRQYTYNKGNYQSHYFDNRVVLNGDLSRNINAVLALGVELQHVRTEGDLASGSASTINIFNPTYLSQEADAYASMSPYHYVQTTNQASLYALASVDFTKYVTFNYGIRYMSVNGRGTAFGISNSYNTGHTVHSGGLAFNLPYGITPYVNYSQAFNAKAPVPTSATGYATFNYNKANAFQTGVKYAPELFDGSFEVSYFNIKNRNPFERSYTNGSFTQNDLEQRSHGWELSANVNLTSFWQASLAYTYTSATTYRSTGSFQSNGIPKNVVSLWNNFKVGSDVTVGVGTRYVGTVAARNIAYVAVPGGYQSTAYASIKPVWLLDAMVSWQATKDWNVTLNATNLFNKTYLTNCNSVCYFGPNRNVSVTAQYRF
ncbi:TonB-dependent siderophore receptor [Psittacicella melopsittaci]|nr:TonB-dependent siderophore receptor [Psittacicella melopsittaci]